ncbi:hypothetical protein GJ744_001728 [Endocarpon pusillum]|uniref:Uncharacterized protein n=1 Tax=Endocarpon pusillum TaxID=364733 RepID=A0A8H7A8X9_9EURO|nr:hypothetical protein GJ744_001728 [Endocarpon pusillum]
MHGTWLSFSASPTQQVEAWKTVVQPYVASTHLATYNIIGAAPRPRCSEDDVPVKAVIRRNKTSSASSSSSRKVDAAATSKTPVTRENLSKISMACAREEDLDAPFSVPSRSLDRRRTGSQTSISSADLPSITEEEE